MNRYELFGKGEVPSIFVGTGTVLGKCGRGQDLESVIKSLDPEANVKSFANGAAAYVFNNLSSAKALSPEYDAFTATVVDYKGVKIGYNGYVWINVASNSLTLLREVIGMILRGTGAQVVGYPRNELNLNHGQGGSAPSAHVSAPRAFLN